MKRKIVALLVSVLVATSVTWPVSGAGGISALAAETQSTVEAETEIRAEYTESETEENNNEEVTDENDENDNEQGENIISGTESDMEKQEEDVEISEENNIENEEKIEETLKENELDGEEDASLATNSEVKNLDERVETNEEPKPAVTALADDELTYQIEGTDIVLYYMIDGDEATITLSYGDEESISIPDTIDGYRVSGIGDKAFAYNYNLVEINLPDGITSIGDEAFYYCDSLTKINLPDELTSIGEYAFCACSSLTEISFPEGLSNIGHDAFRSCYALENLNLPNGITSIESGTFSYCSNLVEINLPDGITNLGASAFYECSSLTEIKLPEGLTEVGRAAFAHCNNLEKVSLPNTLTNIGFEMFYGCNSLTEINFPEGLTSIEQGAFQECSSLTKVNFPEKLTDIGYHAFQKCSNLEAINFPEGLSRIGDGAFSDCDNLKEIDFPDTLTTVGVSLGYYTFSDCDNLTQITLPSGLTSLGGGTFSDCSNLVEINFPNTLTHIGSGVFSGCDSLTEIGFPDGLINIGSDAFANCDNLKRIFIPKSLEEIYENAFSESNQLTDVYYAGSEADWEKIIIHPGSEILDSVTIRFNADGFEDPSQESPLKIKMFTGWDSDNKIASFFPSWESIATEKTDMSFLNSLDSLLNNYVLITTESVPGALFQDNLISIQFVETQRGTVSEMTDKCAIIDGETYQFMEGFNVDLFYTGDVVYHLIDDRICGISALTWSDEGTIGEWADTNTFEFNIDLNSDTYMLSPLAATQIKEKLAQYEEDDKIKLLVDDLNMVYDVQKDSSGDTDDNFEHSITKFISYNQDTKEVITYDNKTYTLPESLYTEELMNQWVDIYVSIETGNVIKSIERFKPDIFVNIELLNQGPIYVNNGKYSYDGKDYYDKNNFSIPLRFTVENQEYSSTMITPEMMAMMQNDGVDFDVSLNKVTFNLPNNFGWIEDKEIKLESNVILKLGEKWTAEGAIRPEFFDSLNDDAEREELIQVTVKWNDSEEEGRVISFTLKNMEKVEKALDEIEKGSKEIAEKAEKVNILKLQTSGLVTEKQLEEINASVAVWLSTITNPDCPTTIKKGMFDSYEYDAGNRTIKSTFKIPVEVVDGNTIKKVNFVFRAVIQDFDFSGIWEQIGLKLDSLGTFSTLEWKIEELSQYNNYQLCSVEASANIGNLNSAISEYAKSAVKEIKEVLTSTDSLPFNEAIENLPAPESYLTSLIRTILINIVKGDNAITPKEICEWMEESYGKIIKIKCPVDVYVYHDGVECARIVNNQLNEEIAQTNLGSIASVSGDEKTLVLLGGGYKIELVGNDTGTMDYIVEEYSNFGSGMEPRIIKFDNLPLTKGMKYTGYIDNQILQSKEEYALEYDGKSIIPDYDTLEGDEIKDLPAGNIPNDDNSPDSGNTGSTGSDGNFSTGNSHTSGGSSSGNSSSPSDNSSSDGTAGAETETPIVNITNDQNHSVADNAAEASIICSCEEKCDAESINSDCPICSIDYTQCTAEGADSESEKAVPSDTETEQNDVEAESDNAVNAELPAKEESDVSIFGLVLVLLVLLLGSGVAIYYFKKVKPEQKRGKGH